MKIDLPDIVQLCDEISACDSIRKLRKKVTEICALLGWEYWLYTTRIPLKFSRNKSLLLTNFPFTWLAYYHFNKLIRIDPVFNYPALSILPIIWETHSEEWDDATRETRRFRDALDKFGWTGGVTVPVQSQLSRGLMNFTTKEPFADKQNIIPMTRMVGPAIALSLQDQMFKLVVEPKFGIRDRLSNREMEVLRYAADGFATKVIADKLGIADRTVIDYLQSTARKLGTATSDDEWKIEGKNRQELVIKAFAFGFLNQSEEWEVDTVMNKGFYEEHEIDDSKYDTGFIK